MIEISEAFYEDAPVERVTAFETDGVWMVETWTPAGTTTRPASEFEAAQFELQANPPPPPPSAAAQFAGAVVAAIPTDGTPAEQLSAITAVLTQIAAS